MSLIKMMLMLVFVFFFSSRRRHTRYIGDWSSDVCSSDLARALSDHLIPRTPAYREIWLDGERIAGGEEEVVEPIYGKTYLPRKFKTVVAVPPSNDVDVFAHDLGYIAIVDDKGDVTGWNVTVGGGMGMTHGEPDTYPRTADVLGFCATKEVIAVAEAV